MKTANKPVTIKQLYKDLYSAKRHGQMLSIHDAVQGAVLACGARAAARLAQSAERTYRRKMNASQTHDAFPLELRLWLYKNRDHPVKINMNNGSSITFIK
ncbi:hypothetical protein [Aliivibrio finisterrensis]|uniref:Uncharacterized protein n=1 Tax=Aliivibrio finisterrensis TaxID=511998 RepID=A0ABY0I2G4_9GAMM|nr:hypothetical protein [Aliivibrio finisterrensis]RYU62174.1 hypothetical protein ERW53_16810 [Aliivibrio finisterrensis]RYU84476.1 hypothetical protein ERW52_10935 [Aliivibrio finisterrensis]